jgi:hypothetical protein
VGGVTHWKKILTDIGDNSQVGTQDIISKHVTEWMQNLTNKIIGQAHKSKR